MGRHILIQLPVFMGGLPATVTTTIGAEVKFSLRTRPEQVAQFVEALAWLRWQRLLRRSFLLRELQLLGEGLHSALGTRSGHAAGVGDLINDVAQIDREGSQQAGVFSGSFFSHHNNWPPKPVDDKGASAVPPLSFRWTAPQTPVIPRI
jgi:hypothetical protein